MGSTEIATEKVLPPSIREFSAALVRSWFPAMSGGLSVPLAVIAIWAPITWVQVTFGITAFIVTWSAAYSIWASERKARNKFEAEAVELHRRLSPKIHINNVRVLMIPEANNSSSKWVQFVVQGMLVRLTPKGTRFGDDFVGTLAHCMLARLSPLHFGCCHEPVYSPS